MKRKENFDFESLRVEGILFPGGLKPQNPISAEPNSIWGKLSEQSLWEKRWKNR